MKKIFNILSVSLFLITIFFSSCKKEEIIPTIDNNNTITQNDAPFEGVLWVLSKARVYVENMDDQTKTVYDYFDANTNEVYTHIFGTNTNVQMDTIKQNFTSWYFQDGTFTLNGGDTWDYTLYNGTYSVIGLPGGTSRPITPTHISDESVTVKFHEAYESNNNTNYHYYSELTFVPAGGSCNNCQPNIPYGWTYGGVWDSTNGNGSDTNLEGTRWVVTRYLSGFGNVYPNDTLDFISQSEYTINNGTPRSYTLSGVIGNNMKSLDLYGFSTIGPSDYSGQVSQNFVNDGVMNNVEFHDMFDVATKVRVWMERIQ